jgi:hypothetical protein
MRTEFLPHTKNYLVESLNKQMTEDINIEFLKHVNLHEAGGSGVGGPAKPKKGGDDTSFLDSPTLFGRSNINLPGALGLYGAGKALYGVADMADAGLGAITAKTLKPFSKLPIIGPALGLLSQFPASLVGPMVRNIADLSGANWFDANVKNIGQSEMMTAATKAAKPFVPLQIPKPQGASEENPYDPDVQRAKAVARAKAEEEAKKYRGMGYSIP